MRKFFTITIDVEPDCTPTWQYSDPLTFFGVSKGITERLQPLFNKHRAKPTYLINNVVLEHDQSVDTFLKLDGSFELGTHLHSEFIEPERLFSDYAGKKGEANQCALPPEVEMAKMRSITTLFEKQFSRKPTSFRAGRFSAGANTIKCLKELGYKVDSSVTPHVLWRDKTRAQPVDYTNAFEQPYMIRDGSYLEAGDNGSILEVPVSIIKRKILFREKPIWLRPHLSSFNKLVKVIETQTKTHSTRDYLIFNIMFHQVEVLPGLSPYCQTETECSTYLGVLDDFFSYCNNHQIKSIGLSDAYDIHHERS
jgi:hypothetical protein